MLQTAELPPVIHQDDSILVINKPAGLIVQLSHTHNQPTLEQALKDTPGLVRRGLVHRLDRDTSGAMVVAKTPSAQQNLQQQFKARQVEKEYQALVWGRVGDEHATINAPILRHPKFGHKFVAAEGGRDAITEVWRQGTYRYRNEPVSLLRIQPHTGRTHQIRVHLAAWGYPIVGDHVYGRRKDRALPRQFLHARRLVFMHPATGQPVQFEAPLADDLAAFLENLQPD